MIRIVTEFVPVTSLLILCDHAHCGVFATQETEVIVDDYNQAIKSFLAGRSVEGWAVGIDRQICPEHVKAAKAAKEQRRIIQIPSPIAH